MSLTTFQAVMLISLSFSLHTMFLMDGFIPPLPSSSSKLKIFSPAPQSSSHEVTNSYPELFIYRRSRKTGSTSMAHALLEALAPYNYVPISDIWSAAQYAVRNEFIRKHPRKVMLIYHNKITKEAHPRRRAVIADTFRNGFAQVTSECRHMRKVQTCGEEMIDCLLSNTSLRINHYRYPLTEGIEDSDSYVDLPLSSGHPALSTTVLRTVFPDIVLDIDKYNIRDSACNETEALRKVYGKHYKVLENQTKILKKRMLIVAGYPFEMARAKLKRSFSLDDMLDAAEENERLKYDGLNTAPVTRAEHSDNFKHFRGAMKKWYVDSNGKLRALVVINSSEELKKDEST